MMNLRIQITRLAALFLLLAPPYSATAQKPAPAKKQTYESFAMVRTRNIFDPDRQGNAPITNAQPVVAAPTAADYASLTGTLVTADKLLAFFSGSRSEFNKVLPVGSTIAGATITKISPNEIVINRDEKPITIAVGQTVPLDASSVPTAAPITAANPTPASADQPNTSNTAASSSKEAIMRRMMEKRQKELK